jgi:hypothetical protein
MEILYSPPHSATLPEIHTPDEGLSSSEVAQRSLKYG